MARASRPWVVTAKTGVPHLKGPVAWLAALTEHFSMSEDLSTENLLARAARRDVAALGELYDRYAPRVYGLMARILPSRAAA